MNSAKTEVISNIKLTVKCEKNDAIIIKIM